MYTLAEPDRQGRISLNFNYLGLLILCIDNNGAHHLLNQKLTLTDDGSTGESWTSG